MYSASPRRGSTVTGLVIDVDVRERRDLLGEIDQTGNVSRCQRVAVRILDHQVDVRLVPAGKFVDEPVERGARLLVLGERGHVVVREAEVKEWRTQHEDERDDRNEYDEGAPHDRRCDGVPPPGPCRIGLQEGDAAAPEVACR